MAKARVDDYWWSESRRNPPSAEQESEVPSSRPEADTRDADEVWKGNKFVMTTGVTNFPKGSPDRITPDAPRVRAAREAGGKFAIRRQPVRMDRLRGCISEDWLKNARP